ncbi:PucR family transcriptional regulator ligand-binding domain-containing protein, partial [Kineococcus rubinsiae]|uniref:PucR family transcriptional regulator ligand-binding domain-containing protein n=1 Tax=Kineococcus rubinsiae TaxID=2609562 RepID=UPI001AD8B397
MVTVADLLAVDGLALRALGGPTGTALRWVATSELDDPTPFLEGGELLLTTGLRVAGATAPGGGDWPGWVAGLARAGVAAVGFGVGLGHREVPAGLVAAGHELGVGVLEVPPPTPFIAISRAVADLLQRGEQAADTAALQTVRELTREAGGAAAAPRVLRRLAAAVGGVAWLL